MEERLHNLARTDHLTTLPNRFLLDERIANGLAQSRREGSLLAMLMIDLDRFKKINDTLGHGGGGEVVKLVGITPETCIWESGKGARLGGGGIVVVMAGLPGFHNPLAVAQNPLNG